MVLSPVRRFRATFFRFSVLAAVALAAVFLPACKQAVKDPNDPKFIVAEKDKWQITKAELDVAVNDFLKERNATPEQVGPAKMPVVQTALLKNLVLKKLILDRATVLPLKDLSTEETAEMDKVKATPNLAQQLQKSGKTMDDLKTMIHEKVIFEKVLDAEAFKNTDPSDAEISDFYMKNKASITAPPQVRASRILVHTDEKMTPAEKAGKKKAIDKAYARVQHGEEFSKVAAEMSEDQSSKMKGGDLDYFQPNENEPGFDVVAFSTKKGELSPVFPTALGYQFIKVTDVKPGGPVPLADVRPKIAQFLKQRKMQQESQEYATKLLADPAIKYHLVLVDPPAQTMGGPGGPGGAPGGPGGPSGPPPEATSGSAPSGSTPPPSAPPATSPSAPQ